MAHARRAGTPSRNWVRSLVLIREATDADVPAIARLLLEADDARVVSAAGILYMLRTRPARGRTLDLVAEINGAVVATGASGLNISTTTEGAAWAFVSPSVIRGRAGRASAGRWERSFLSTCRGSARRRRRRSSGGPGRASGGRRVAPGGLGLLGGPLIAVDPRTVAEPSIPIGYRCVPMTSVAPEAVYEAVRAAALDEPTPIRHDDIRLDDFLREWNEPDADLESSTAVLDESGGVVASPPERCRRTRPSTASPARCRSDRGRGLVRNGGEAVRAADGRGARSNARARRRTRRRTRRCGRSTASSASNRSAST